ncbi:molybdopterin-dependent oxidoreductase [Nannocystis radixulma]|uniref:Molybdopterin-dependent oxidoreductase n=1 Tax=Nannocystis radixulma TaxID=2995305 RepID=A0ABT5BGH5_9BACT|nr:molybdopterin-dependent oxidoreductase [Nannocystis radixulma]MDC0673234.1 molybdopterin-dependent oxidoreductase [Nannocystis radixulma]
MSPPISRRGILRGTLGGTVLVSESCTPPKIVGERAEAPGLAPPDATADDAANPRLEFTINGAARSLAVDPEHTALELVRNDLGLTGCKESCGHGACGACTVLLDDAPVAACLLPAVALHRRKLTTVEGLAPVGELHPVQRAFMAEDALQCGFCTPGFVVAASAFYRRWRAEHANQEPDRDTVAAALAGNLCRCGAYDGIIRAVQKASAGAYEKPLGPEPAAPRYDARDKVTGAAKYTVDVRLPDQLEGKILRSPHAHARVRKVDWSKALKLPGVAGVVDLLHGSTTLRFAGQEIAAVAAVDARTAEAALAAIELDLEVLPALVGMDAARAPGAAPVYPTRNTRKSAPNSSEGPLLPLGWDGNVRGPFKLFSTHKLKARGAVDRLRKQPAEGVLVEGTYKTQVQCHSSHEPHACVAHWTAPDAVTVHLSTQAVHAVAEDIAERWSLKRANVRVLAAYVGGGFGSKATLQLECVAAVELAKITGKPVRVALERREELVTGGLRPAQEIELAVAADRDGYLQGVTARAFADAGCGIGATSTVLLRLMYAKAPKDISDWDVVNHGPPGKPFRGPGGPPIFWALEQAVDVAADRLGLDPVLLRKRWDPNPARNQLYDWALSLKTWRERQPAQSDRGRYRRGLGLAVGGWFYFVQPSARVQLDAGPDGIVVSTACQDIGNGTRTVLAETVARVLGIAPAEVVVQIGDSSFVPGPMSGGSRTTASLVPAATMAAEQLRDELLDRAQSLAGARGVAVAGGVRHPGGLVTWKQLLAGSPPLRFVGTRKRDQGGYFLPPMYDLAPGRYVAGALQIIEVEVDTRLGRIRVLRSHTGVAAGRIVAPALARSQVLGGVIQGIGYALYEERRLDPRSGTLLTAGLEDYRITGIGDIGELDVHFVEDGYERVNGRSVGLAELVTVAPAAAIGNAVAHATGFRPRELPLRPDRVLQGVRG